MPKVDCDYLPIAQFHKNVCKCYKSKKQQRLWPIGNHNLHIYVKFY